MPTWNKKNGLFITLISLGCLLLGALGYSPVEAALKAQEILTVEEPQQDVLGEKNAYNFPGNNGGENFILRERLFQRTPQGSALQAGKGHSLRLKSPGKLPGIEFGVEMHSLQAFQTVIPAENLPKGVDLKQEKPLLLPPSINAPDYNGGFLRFTW